VADCGIGLIGVGCCLCEGNTATGGIAACLSLLCVTAVCCWLTEANMTSFGFMLAARGFVVIG
jgi:hypothetical protein